MAIESPRVKADVIEASEFPQYVSKYHVVGVPKVVINEFVEFDGALPEDRYLDEVLKGAASAW